MHNKNSEGNEQKNSFHNVSNVNFVTIIASEKRARPYSFGLGKRLYSADDNEVDRRQERLYNFGLGRR